MPDDIVGPFNTGRGIDWRPYFWNISAPKTEPRRRDDVKENAKRKAEQCVPSRLSSRPSRFAVAFWVASKPHGQASTLAHGTQLGLENHS